MPRVLNIDIKRFSLRDLGDAWQDCYIEYSPMTVGDLKQLATLKPETMTDTEGAIVIAEHVKTHVVGGRVSVRHDDGSVTTEALKDEDVDYLPPNLIGDLFLEMTTGGVDPKASQKAAAPSSEPTSESKATDTPSS